MEKVKTAVKKLWGYISAAIGIALLSKQEITLTTLLITLGGYVVSIGIIELFLNCECKETQSDTEKQRPVKKLWAYLAAVAGIFLAASQVNMRLTLITLGGYLIGSAVASCKLNKLDVVNGTTTQPASK